MPDLAAEYEQFKAWLAQKEKEAVPVAETVAEYTIADVLKYLVNASNPPTEVMQHALHSAIDSWHAAQTKAAEPETVSQ